MLVFSWTSWFFAASMGIVNAAGSKTSGVMEVDLVFPRNQTYAPMEFLPVVFAYQNPELEHHLHPRIGFTLFNWDDNIKGSENGGYYEDLPVNLSGTDPYFRYDRYRGDPKGIFNAEGTWMLKWSLMWRGCTPESAVNSVTGERLGVYAHTTSVMFTIKNGSQAVDFAGPTQENDCRPWSGIAIDVTNILEDSTGQTCAVLATSTPTANACRVKIDSAAAASISASLDPTICTETTNLPPGCPPPRKNSAQGLMVGGVWFLAAALGAVGYLLV